MRILILAVGILSCTSASAFLLSPSSFAPSGLQTRSPALSGLQPQAQIIRAPRLRCKRNPILLASATVEKEKWGPPPPELLSDALDKAEEVVRSAGGCIDSLSFGQEWREKFPEFSKDRFKGTTVTSFNKLLSVHGTDRFMVQDTKRKAIKLYILRDAQGEAARLQYEQAEKQLKELANSPLGEFFNIRGGVMKGGATKSLPPNLASYTKLDELLNDLEPNLVAFAGGVSQVSGKDAATALNQIKRLQYQARHQVQQNRLQSAIKVFANVALKQMTNMNPKSVSLFLNAIADREGFDKCFDEASQHLQALASKESNAEFEVVEDLWSPQAVAVIVNAFAKVGRRDVPLFRAMSTVVSDLPNENFDAQAVANIANAFAKADARPFDEKLFGKLRNIAAELPAESWNPAALAIFSSALVKADAVDSELMRQLGDNTLKVYEAEGAEAFWSPTAMSQLLAAMATAGIQHEALFSTMGKVALQHLTWQAPGKDGQKKKQKGKPKASTLKIQKPTKMTAGEKFQRATNGVTLASLAKSLRWGGQKGKRLWLILGENCRMQTFSTIDISALADAVQAFAPAGDAQTMDFLSSFLLGVPEKALNSPGTVAKLLAAVGAGQYNDGQVLTKLVKAVLALEAFAFTPALVADMAESILAVNNPRYMGPLGPHLAGISEKVLRTEADSVSANPKIKATFTVKDMSRMLSGLHALGRLTEEQAGLATQLLPRLSLTAADCDRLEEVADLFSSQAFDSHSEVWRQAAADNNILTRIGSLGA